MATQHYDTLETRDPAGREKALMAALPRIIAAAKEHSLAYRHLLAAVRAEDIVDRRTLAELPLTRKSALIELQRQNPPFGGFVAAPLAALRRVFVSPGPIYEPEARRPDYWRFARALFAAGFRAGDLLHNTFSYHLTPAGAMVGFGARFGAGARIWIPSGNAGCDVAGDLETHGTAHPNIAHGEFRYIDPSLQLGRVGHFQKQIAFIGGGAH